MTLKIQDLEVFISEIKTTTGSRKTRIPLIELQLMIARKFGISQYIQKNIMETLKTFGLIEEDMAPGIIHLIYNDPVKDVLKSETKIIDKMMGLNSNAL